MLKRVTCSICNVMTPGKEKENEYYVWLFYGTLMPCEYANNLVLTFFMYFRNSVPLKLGLLLRNSCIEISNEYY